MNFKSILNKIMPNLSNMQEESMNYEGMLENIYSQIIKNGDLVIDVGAHSGRHTKPISKLVGNTGKVIAFEPNPTAREWLVNNLSDKIENGIVSIYPYAISNEAIKTKFIVANERPEESGLKNRQYNGPTSTSEIDVEVIQLDSMLDKIDTPLKFIKIDVEGAEFDAMKGACKIIKTYRPVISFEFGESSYKAYDVNPENVFDYLSDFKYQIFSIFGEQLNKDSFVNASKVQQYWDYIACPDEKTQLLSGAFNDIQTK